MLLVTQGKGRINQLGFDKSTSEYVFFHKGREIWREKGDKSLFDYFSDLRTSNYALVKKNSQTTGSGTNI